MPDIQKLLWPRSVAIFIAASSDIRGLRGHIVQVMRGRIIVRGLGLP